MTALQTLHRHCTHSTRRLGTYGVGGFPWADQPEEVVG